MLIYLDPTDSSVNLYKRLMKERVGHRKELIVSKAVDEFSFGFLHLSRNTSNEVRGFVLCRYLEEFNDVVIDLIWSRKHTRLELMNAAEGKAREVKAGRLVLYSVREERLKQWYESLGFIKTGEIPRRRGVVRTYMMMKRLCY